MIDASLEELVEERQFAELLGSQADAFFRLTNTLTAHAEAGRAWTKSHFFQLVAETDALESFLDDFGGRYNRTYAGITELVASLRWFANSGYSISHLLARLRSYGNAMWESSDLEEEARVAISKGLDFLRTTSMRLIAAVREEANELGVEIRTERLPEGSFLAPATQLKLPRNVGQEELVNEEQKIAEVATKFLQGAEMVAATGVRAFEDERERRRFLAKVCTEAKARVYEATIHNLQSTYDTHIRNTVLEGKDERLPRLRGHASAALHLLQAVTDLAHFLERHESDHRAIEAQRRVFELVERAEVERVTAEVFLAWAHRILQNGTDLAEDLLPEYTNLQELELELPVDVVLHARPAALIVGIVNHYGTPVEMQIRDHRCNAASILELLVAVGSNPDERQYVFHGDERPLRDIEKLFAGGLGEGGMDKLPPELDYLRQQ